MRKSAGSLIDKVSDRLTTMHDKLVLLFSRSATAISVDLRRPCVLFSVTTIWSNPALLSSNGFPLIFQLIKFPIPMHVNSATLFSEIFTDSGDSVISAEKICGNVHDKFCFLTWFSNHGSCNYSVEDNDHCSAQSRVANIETHFAYQYPGSNIRGRTRMQRHDASCIFKYRIHVHVCVIYDNIR